MRTTTIALLSLSLATVAHGHPGHGTGGDPWGLLHHLTEPLHVASGIAVAAIVLGLFLRLRRRDRGSSF